MFDTYALWICNQEEKDFMKADQSFGVTKFLATNPGENLLDVSVFARTEATLQFMELIEKAVDGVTWHVLLIRTERTRSSSSVQIPRLRVLCALCGFGFTPKFTNR